MPVITRKMAEEQFQQMVKDSLKTLQDQLQQMTKNISGVTEEVCSMSGQVQGNGSSYFKLSFSGHSSEDSRSFIEKFIAQSELSKWDLDRKLRAFRLALTDIAEIWYRELRPEIRGDWESLLKAYNDRFRNEDDKWILEGALHTRQQLPGENVESYSSAMRRLFSKLNKSDCERLSLYVHGLRPELKSFVMGKNPKTVEEADSAARLFECVGAVNHPKPAVTLEAISTIQETVKNLEKQIASMNVSKEHQQSHQQPTWQSDRPRPWQSDRPRPWQSDRTTDGQPICTRCNGKGHTRQSCRRQTYICYTCNTPGHISRECRRRNYYPGPQNLNM